MSVEVIIPAYRPDKSFRKVLTKLYGQSVRPDKITVLLTIDSKKDIDAVSADIPSEVEIIAVDKSDFSHGGTRQMGMDRATCEYVLFMTQDALPVDDLLIENLLKALEDSDSCMAYARQVPYRNANDVEKFTRRYNYPKTSRTQTYEDLEINGIKAIFCSDSCAMHKKSIHQQLGGFDTETQFNEDAMFAYKALNNGYNIEYCAEARVFHSHNLSVAEQFRRNRDNARSQKEHPEVYGNIVSEKEGLKYVFTGFDYFIRKKQYRNVFKLFGTAFVRYTGFFVGKHFNV